METGTVFTRSWLFLVGQGRIMLILLASLQVTTNVNIVSFHFYFIIFLIVSCSFFSVMSLCTYMY